MPRRGRPSVVSSASRRGTRVRDFEPVLSEDGSSVGRGSVSGRSRTSSFRHGRRRKGRAHKDNAGILTDNWKPPPKRVVKVAPATIKNFYSMMPDEKQHNSETAFADRGEGARRGTRGMFLATPGYDVIPPHFPKGHAFEAHTGDATLDAAVPCDDWFVAAAYGRLKLLEVAAEVVDVNLRSHLHPFETPLHVAAGEGHAHVVQFLVTRGANINAKDANGNTPLHYATKRNKKDAVQMLLSVAAAHDIENRDGEPPLTIAMIEGYRDITKLLKAAKAGDEIEPPELKSDA